MLLLAVVLGGMVCLVILALEWQAIYDLWYERQTGYRFVWMPENVFPWGNRTLNNSGQVAVDIRENPSLSKGAVWSPSDPSPLQVGTLPGSPSLSNAHSINDSGCVVGYINRLMDGGVVAMGQRGFLWNKEKGMVEIPGPGGISIYPSDINSGGQVVGTAAGPRFMRGFLWRQGSLALDLGSLIEDGDSYGTAINNRGWVVGDATAADGKQHPFLWIPDRGMLDLGMVPGFEQGVPQSIDEKGSILINFYGRRPSVKGGESSVPYFWMESNGFSALSLPQECDEATALGMNSAGTILLRARVGSDGAQRHFLVIGSDLRELPQAPRDALTMYCSINDHGWLSGYIDSLRKQDDLAMRRGFLAKPIR